LWLSNELLSVIQKKRESSMKHFKMISMAMMFVVGAGVVANAHAGWWGWGHADRGPHRGRSRPPKYRCDFGESDMSGDTFVLFYDSSGRSRDAKEAVNEVRRRARRADAPVEFEMIHVDKRRYEDCADAYNLDEIPTVAFFEGGDTGSYSVLAGRDITEKRLRRFVERQARVDLDVRDRKPRRGRARVGIGIGIGTPYWGGWGWGRGRYHGRHHGHHGRHHGHHGRRHR